MGRFSGNGKAQRAGSPDLDGYEQGDLERGDYIRRAKEIKTTLATLAIPRLLTSLDAGEYLEWLTGLWNDWTRQEQRVVLHFVLTEVVHDVGERKVMAVKPYRGFAPQFRFDGLEEREDGYFYIARGQEVGRDSGADREERVEGGQQGKV